MKKIIFLIIMVLFASVYPQSNWTNVKETNITVGLYDGVDIFTNRYGNHIIIQETNILKYYRMDVNGYSNPTLFPKTIESAAVVSSSISGDDNNIYIVYGLGNNIRVKRSTNGGLTWSLWTTYSLLTPAGGIESVFSSEKLHVTYLESAVVKYINRSRTGGSWNGPYTVSEGETGNFPRITAYKNEQMDYVYFMYRKTAPTNYECKWRRFNVTNGTWHTPLYTAPIGVPDIVEFSGFRVDNANVVIYFRWHEDFWDFFAWEVLDLYNNHIFYGNADVNNAINGRMYSTPTADGKTHTAFYYVQLAGPEYSDVGLWRSYAAEEYPTDEFYSYEEPEDSIWHLNLSSAGNEVHVIWQDPFGSN